MDKYAHERALAFAKIEYAYGYEKDETLRRAEDEQRYEVFRSLYDFALAYEEEHSDDE